MFTFSQFGDQKHVRKLFARALMATTESPETIGTEWIRYESLYGDLDTLLCCKEKFKTRYGIRFKLFRLFNFYFLYYYYYYTKYCLVL